MSASRVRPKAVCVIRRGDSILVGSGVDTVKGETFFGPLGGEIEFGERAADAVVREMQEELGVALRNLELRGVLENVFTYEGRPGHEIVFVFEADLADRTLYDRDEIDGLESHGMHFSAKWTPLSHFAPGARPLYPEGLYQMLAGRSTDFNRPVGPNGGS